MVPFPCWEAGLFFRLLSFGMLGELCGEFVILILLVGGVIWNLRVQYRSMWCILVLSEDTEPNRAILLILVWCVLYWILDVVIVGEQGPFASKYLCVRNLHPAMGHLRGNEIQNLSSLPGSDEKWEFCCLWCPPGEDGV